MKETICVRMWRCKKKWIMTVLVLRLVAWQNQCEPGRKVRRTPEGVFMFATCEIYSLWHEAASYNYQPGHVISCKPVPCQKEISHSAISGPWLIYGFVGIKLAALFFGNYTGSAGGWVSSHGHGSFRCHFYSLHLKIPWIGSNYM